MEKEFIMSVNKASAQTQSIETSSLTNEPMRIEADEIHAEDTQIVHVYRRQTKRSAQRDGFQPPRAFNTWVKGDNHDFVVNFELAGPVKTVYIPHDNGLKHNTVTHCINLYKDAERMAHSMVDTCSNHPNITVLIAEIGHRDGPLYALPVGSGDILALGLYKSSASVSSDEDSPNSVDAAKTGSQKLSGRDTVNGNEKFNGSETVIGSQTGSQAASAFQAAAIQYREKRETGSYTVKLVLVIDYSRYKFWYELTPANMSADGRDRQALSTMETFYVFHVNGIDMRYRSLASYGLDIAVKLVGIYVLKSEASFVYHVDNSMPRGKVDVETLLPDFQAWIASKRSDDASFPVGDHYMFLTSHDLALANNTEAAGYAQGNSMCSNMSTSLVEERFNFLSVTIETHELGHALGGRHDGDNNVCSSDDGYILSASNAIMSASKARNPWGFSNCSAKDIGAFLASHAFKCLLIDDKASLLNITDRKYPGQTYSPDDQCRHAIGQRSEFSRSAHVGAFADICTGMSCTTDSVQLLRNVLPADGTSCGNRKWCVNGTCVTSTEAEAKNETCIFGDQPGELVPGTTCSDRVIAFLGNCYHEETRAPCCKTCSQRKLDIAGCEYGDRSNCSAIRRWQCYNETIRTVSCCKTCADFRGNISGCEYGNSYDGCPGASSACVNYPQECCETCRSSNTRSPSGSTQATTAVTSKGASGTTQKSDAGDTLPEWVVPVAAGGGGALVLCIVVAVVCCCCCRRGQQKDSRGHSASRSGRPRGRDNTRPRQYPRGEYRGGSQPGSRRPDDFRYHGRHRY